MANSKQKKIVDYLFKNCVNTSSRKVARPKDEPNVVVEITTIGLSYNPFYNQMTVRVQFVGSEKFFVLGIDNHRIDYWFNNMKEFIVESSDIDFNTTEQEEDSRSANATPIFTNDELCDRCRLPESSCVCGEM